MAGIFFDGGVTWNNTLNATASAEVTEGCLARFYPARCNVAIDPLQMNAIISELVNAVNIVNQYDCTRLDNLAVALETISNLCGLPFALQVAMTDTLAGCFGGLNARVTVEDLINTIKSQLPTICELPTNETPDITNVYLGACVAGVEQKIRATDVTDRTLGGPMYEWVNKLPDRAVGITFQNPYDLPIMISLTAADDIVLEVSRNNIVWVVVNATQANGDGLYGIIPPKQWYRTTGAGVYIWAEMTPTLAV